MLPVFKEMANQNETLEAAAQAGQAGSSTILSTLNHAGDLAAHLNTPESSPASKAAFNLLQGAGSGSPEMMKLLGITDKNQGAQGLIEYRNKHKSDADGGAKAMIDLKKTMSVMDYTIDQVTGSNTDLIKSLDILTQAEKEDAQAYKAAHNNSAGKSTEELLEAIAKNTGDKLINKLDFVASCMPDYDKRTSARLKSEGEAADVTKHGDESAAKYKAALGARPTNNKSAGAAWDTLKRLVDKKRPTNATEADVYDKELERAFNDAHPEDKAARDEKADMSAKLRGPAAEQWGSDVSDRMSVVVAATKVESAKDHTGGALEAGASTLADIANQNGVGAQLKHNLKNGSFEVTTDNGSLISQLNDLIKGEDKLNYKKTSDSKGVTHFTFYHTQAIANYATNGDASLPREVAKSKQQTGNP